MFESSFDSAVTDGRKVMSQEASKSSSSVPGLSSSNRTIWCQSRLEQ